MNWERNRNSREVREACRRITNAGEAERQTVYTLLLTFVPYAAIVGVLAVVSSARVIESLSRHLRQVDSTLDAVRELAGAGGETDPEALVRRARWAFNNKEAIEVHYVGVADANWEVGGKTGNISVLAGLSRRERQEAVYRSILTYVADQLPGLGVGDISEEACTKAEARAAAIAKEREDPLYRGFMVEGLLDKKLTQGDVQAGPPNWRPSSVADITLDDDVNEKIKAWLDERRTDFQDRPKSWATIDKDLGAEFRKNQLAAIWAGYQQLCSKIDTGTITRSLLPADFLESRKNGTIGEICQAIENQVLSLDERGPLTKLAAERRAEEVFNQKREVMATKLCSVVQSTPLPPDTVTQAMKVVRKDVAKAETLVLDPLLKKLAEVIGEEGSNRSLALDDLNGLPSVVQAIGNRKSQEMALIGNTVGQKVRNGIDGWKTVNGPDEVLRQYGSLLPQVANVIAEGREISPKTIPGLEAALAEAERRVIELNGYPLMDKERQEVCGVVIAHLRLRAKEQTSVALDGVKAVTRVDGLTRIIDLKQFRDDSVSTLVDQVHREILIIVPGATSYAEARQQAAKRAEELVNAARVELQNRLVNHLRESLRMQLGSIGEVPVDKNKRMVFAETLLAKAFPVDANDIIAALEDLDIGSRGQVLAEVQQRLSDSAVMRAIAALSASDLPAEVVGTPDERQKAFDALKQQIVDKIGCDFSSESEQRLLEKVGILVDERRKRTVVAQSEAIKALTVTDVPTSIVPLIVAAGGDEASAVGAAQKALTVLVCQRTNARILLDGVRADLDARSVALVKEKHREELDLQCRQVMEKTSNYVIDPIAGQTFDELLNVCVNDICALAGIAPDRQLPGTRSFLRDKLHAQAELAWNSMTALQEKLRQALIDIGGRPDSKDPKPLPIPIPAGVSGLSVGEMERALAELLPQVDKKRVMDAARLVMRKELEWQPEWFRYGNPDYPFTAAPETAHQEVAKRLRNKGLDPVDVYQKDIKEEVNKEFKDILAWCRKETNRLLDSPEGKRLLEEVTDPYAKGSKDVREWYSEGDYMLDAKKVAAAAATIVGRLITSEAGSGATGN